MKRKVVVIGLGHLGAHVIQALAIRGCASELVGIDYNKKKQYGEIRDLQDMMAYLPGQCQIREGDYEDLADADIMVMTACGKICDEDRLQELDGSIAVMDQILPGVMNNHFHGTIVVLSNPCDLVAYYLAKKTGCRVIGTGTALDSARLRCRVGETLHVAPACVEGYCLGEHGDSQVIAWSQVKVGGKRADELLTPEQKQAIELDTIQAGCNIALAKGSTEYGIGMAATEIIQSILNDEHKVIPCSVDPAGYCGQSGCYASVPCIVSQQGAVPLPPADLSEDEQAHFIESCNLMRRVIREKGI